MTLRPGRHATLHRIPMPGRHSGGGVPATEIGYKLASAGTNRKVKRVRNFGSWPARSPEFRGKATIPITIHSGFISASEPTCLFGNASRTQCGFAQGHSQLPEHHGVRMPQQVPRLVVVFSLLVIALLAARRLLIPETFGEYGHYRAAAADVVAAHPIKYAGRQACEVCHTEEAEARLAGNHRGVGCETCHGPAAAHVDSALDVKPVIGLDDGALDVMERVRSRKKALDRLIVLKDFLVTQLRQHRPDALLQGVDPIG